MNYNFPVNFMDAPGYVDATVTPIPGSGSLPLQVIANTSANNASIAVDYMDSTGQLIGVYKGPIGQEVRVCIIGNGLNWCSLGVIAVNTRVSIRSMTTNPIIYGKLSFALLGY